ncbi:MAG: adenylosuccinate synthetase [Spirochaetales bacterium]|jgi:adenylosuccinate synthase|nr:adenylosuccinate synthetase [Spirochaetales bacterium]
MIKGRVVAVIGGQYGDEGAGRIVHHIADNFSVHVRTGDGLPKRQFTMAGEEYLQAVIPCGWTSAEADLVIARGSLVDLDRFKSELDFIKTIDPLVVSRIFIDELATVYVNNEPRMLAKHAVKLPKYKWLARMLEQNTPKIMRGWGNKSRHILLEGCGSTGQNVAEVPVGSMCAARDTGVAQMCASAGIPPQFVNCTILVCKASTALKQMDVIQEAVTLNAPTTIALMGVPDSASKYADFSRKTRDMVRVMERRLHVPVGIIGTEDEIVERIKMSDLIYG